jgi:phage repressor protein C with HTH and peptisase S24 domain
MVPALGLWDLTHMTEGDRSALQEFVSDALKLLPQKRDWYDRQYQDRTGTTGKPLYDIERGKNRNPSRSTLRQLAEIILQPVDLLARAADGERVSPVPLSPSRQADIPPARDASENETVGIQRLDLSLSMGQARTSTITSRSRSSSSTSASCAGLRLPRRRMLRLVSGIGDSMFPTLLDTDLMFLDVGQRVLNMQDRIWGISLYGAGAIKRLRAIGGNKVLVISDNPNVEDQEVDAADIQIAGRIVGAVRRHRYLGYSDFDVEVEP